MEPSLRHTRPSIATSMTGPETSSVNDTKRTGVASTGSPASISTDKRAVALQPGLLAALEALIEDTIRGDPETPLRWVSRSQRQIARALLSRGFQVSQKLVGLLLRELGYSCQANRKTREGTNHPDRDAQFTYINTVVQA